MSTTALRCYRCGESLAALSLPLGRLDECPECTTQLHVCRMCSCYDPRAIDACTEEDAPVVQNKHTPNFCDYFKPSADAFTGRERDQARRASLQLAALFGDAQPAAAPADADDDTQSAAEALFRSPKDH